MFSFEGVEYSSKADCVRAKFDSGELNMTSVSKKLFAEKLQMTVQSVHATLIKHTLKVPSTSRKSRKENINKEAINEIIKTKKPVIINNFIDDKTQESLVKETANDPHRFLVTQAPNPWGLPVTVPPMVVIDIRFTQKTLDQWKPEPEMALYEEGDK